MYAIEVKHLYKQYKTGVQALNDFNVSVKEGEIFTLLGPNGAGKSTFIHILTTYLKASQGEVTLFGENIHENVQTIRSHIAWVAQRPSLDMHLSLKENMMFQSRLYQIPQATAYKRMLELISVFSLESYLDYPISSYSGGIKRRLDIALNMMSYPKILFLDEPTVGMDIQSRRAMWDMIRKIRDELKTTIFLTTHYLEEADQLSDMICIMKDGKEVVQGTPKELRKYIQQESIKIQLADEQITIETLKTLHKYYPHHLITRDSHCLIIHTKKSQDDIQDFAQFLL